MNIIGNYYENNYEIIGNMKESKGNEAYHSLRYFAGNMSLNLKLSFLPGWGNNADYFD